MTALPETTRASLVRGNALHLPFGDETVDLIVTSPPYFGQRSYQDGGEHYEGQIGAEPHPQDFLNALWGVMHECWRVLKPTGSVFVNLGDKRSGSGAPGTTSGLKGRRQGGAPIPGQVQGARSQIVGGYNRAAFGRAKSKQLIPHRFAIGCEDGAADPDGIGWIMRQDLVWAKPNGMPESVKDRTTDRHEYWFHLTKQGDYFADLTALRRPHAPSTVERCQPHRAVVGKSRLKGEDLSGLGQPGHSFTPDALMDPDGAAPMSWWNIATQPLVVPDHLDVDHFAAFPMEWPRRLIKGWCPPGGVVLDPFGGTGTAALVAGALGRHGVSLDLSADYLRLARWRTTDPGQRAKALGTKPPPPQKHGQIDLFAEQS